MNRPLLRRAAVWPPWRGVFPPACQSSSRAVPMLGSKSFLLTSTPCIALTMLASRFAVETAFSFDSTASSGSTSSSNFVSTIAIS